MQLEQGYKQGYNQIFGRNSEVVLLSTSSKPLKK